MKFLERNANKYFEHCFGGAFFLEVSSITKKLTLKQQRFVDEYIISGNATQAAITIVSKSIKDPKMRQLWALKELAKRYTINYSQLIRPINWDRCIEAVAVMLSKETNKYQKIAAREILFIYFGKKDTYRLIESGAVVTNRNDELVIRWRNRCLKRDSFKCQLCGSTKQLNVHHISYWSADPVNRINPDNGITLCQKCHAKQHIGEQVYKLMESGGDSHD